MTESIATRQNQAQNINRLAAMRELYNKAKYYNQIGLYLNIVVMIALSIFVLVMNSNLLTKPIDLSWLLVLASFSFVLINETFLIPKMNSAREIAAKIQEDFDCDVLQIPWNHMAGDKPSHEEIKQAANKHLAVKGNKEALLNWYGDKETLDQIPISPISVSKLICQRSNTTWDATLREHYLTSLKAILILIILFVLTLAVIMNLSMQSLLIFVIATLLPAITYIFQQYREHKKSLQTLQRLTAKQSALWNQLINTHKVSEIEIRQLQDEIYNHRKQGALIFDWLYYKMKNSQQDSMNYSIKQSAQEYLKNAKNRGDG